MRNEDAIVIKNISKTFKTRVDTGLRKGFKKTEKITRNVINDVSFSVAKGEVFGIIGRNGSGKSTLLKIISGIMKPNTGTIEISGRIASILELGMGFHQDLSGRENIYIKGAMYGFTKEQIDGKIDDIIRYAELEDYIDLPVRVYSSGMGSRLAFAIMINVDADVLILDEILSTGDLSFSKKSSAHFSNMKKRGKTIILVSHSMNTMRGMCDRVAWIDEGKIKEIGPANTVCGHYETELAESYDVIKELAEAGVPASQNALGCIYRDGSKAEKNIELAAYWFEEAARRDNDNAKINLADMIISGMIAGSRDRVIELYSSAAQKGNRDARNKLSMLLTKEKYDVGKEVVDDFKKILSPGNSWLFYDFADLLMKTAWSSDDKLEALKWYMKSAECGNINAMYQISIMFRDGNGPIQDNAEHLKWLRMAAEGGHARSQLMMGDMYKQGIKVECDEKEAFRWYEAAANNNNIDAIYQVAMMYREGRGIEKNIEMSDKWFRIYSEHDIFRQINTLADSFSHFKNGVYDPDIGMKWYSVNTHHNNPESEYQTALLMLSKGKKYTTEETKYLLESAAKKNHLESANQLLSMYGLGLVGNEVLNESVKHMENIANDGNPWAANVIGHIYADGRIIEANSEKAVTYLKISSNGGISASMQKLGEMYRDGTCVNQDLGEAVKWFEKGVMAGNVRSATSLINMYGAGTAKKDDFDIAIKGLEDMCVRGNTEAMKALGFFYYEKNTTEEGYKSALKWFTMASNFGDVDSKYMIGEMYREGRGIDKNVSEALKWFKSAADRGNSHSLVAILRMMDTGEVDDGLFTYALRRLEQLADGGNVFSIITLGVMNLEGKLIPKDVEKAKMWFKKSAMLGDDFSRNKLKEMSCNNCDG